ncbi:MAG: hypothetical protein JW857_07230 [Bacteroidales bacterium]|nr:hypothetical protein [Bacteroidales bacterium]
MLKASFLESTPVEGFLYGEKGILKIHRNFHHTKEISVFQHNILKEKFDIDYIGNGYYHEIVEVINCLKEGKIESEKMPHSFSLVLIQTLDRIREKIGMT